MYSLLGGINDREFLDNVVTQVIAFDGDGKIYENAGGYQDWITARTRMMASQTAEKKTAAAAPEKKAIEKIRKAKLSFKEERELENLPGEIEKLEQELADLQQGLLDPGLYKEAPLKAREMQARIEAIDALLLEKLERWEELEAKQT